MAKKSSSAGISTEYRGLLASVSALLEEGRRSAAKSVNAVLTSTYWLVGRRIVEYEQGGQERAAFGSESLRNLGLVDGSVFSPPVRLLAVPDEDAKRHYEGDPARR